MDQQNAFDYIPDQFGEVLFEGVQEHDKQFYREFFTYSYFKRPVQIVISALMLLYLIAAFFVFFYWGDGFWLFIPVFYFSLMAVLCIKGIKASWAREQEISNGIPVTTTVRITEFGIIQTNTLGTRYEVDFAKIKWVFTTKSYLFLQTSANLCFSIKKDALTIGNYEALCAFLRSKGYKVKS